jgi:hypothetical protein
MYQIVTTLLDTFISPLNFLYIHISGFFIYIYIIIYITIQGNKTVPDKVATTCT